LPVLAHDPDLPLDTRLALQLAKDAPSVATKLAAKQRAAATLAGKFNLTGGEIADLLGLPEAAGRC